jgi:tyrosine-protein kinase Etk/Wzc
LEGNQTRQGNDGGQIDLIDLLLILAKRKGLIIGITLGLTLLIAIISMLMTPTYLAETKILPPQTNASMAAQLLNQIGAATALLGGVSGAKSPNELYIGLLKSRPVLDHVIDRFNLMKLYDKEYHEDARRTLLKNIKARSDPKSDIITVGVEDKDPKRAADMANALIEELRDMNKGLSVTEASQRRLFFEEQLKDAKDSLSKAEEAMKGFQEKSGAVKIDAQADAIIEGISQLRAQIAAKEVQVRVMRTYSTPQNPDILRAEEELKGLNGQLAKLETKSEGGNVIVPTGDLTATGTQYARLMRDLKFNETLYELLFGQFQAAKIDEARDAAVIQVIEKAVPPEKRAWPKRGLMVILAMISGFVVSTVIAFFMEYVEKVSVNPETKERVETLKKYASFRKKELENAQGKE